MYRDCDHLVDDLHIYTIRGNWNDDESLLLVKPVYERANTSEFFKKIVDRKGVVGENLAWINPQNYDHISCKGIKAENYSGNNVWDRMVHALVQIGISEENIGLFGSKRLGFSNCKDEDFIVYGKENTLLLHKRIDEFKRTAGLYNHTVAHAVYQAETHGKFFDKEKNDLLFCLLNKWSTCAFTDKLTSTIRFVDENDMTGELLRHYFYDLNLEDECTLQGFVTEAEGTSFMPRRFNLNTNDGGVEVITPLWIFHQCVKENDLVRVTGCMVDGKLIVRGYNHGIKFV